MQGIMVSSLGMLTMIFLMNMIRDSFVFEKLGLHLTQPCPILNNAEDLSQVSQEAMYIRTLETIDFSDRMSFLLRTGKCFLSSVQNIICIPSSNCLLQVVCKCYTSICTLLSI